MKYLAGCLFAWLLAFGAGDLLAQEKQWMAVMVNGKKVGYYKKVRVANTDSVVTTELMTYEIDAGTNKVELLSLNVTVETASGKLVRFKKESIQNETKRIVTGYVQNDTLQIAGMLNDHKTMDMMPWPDDVVMVEGRRLLDHKQGITQGTKYHTRQFLVDLMAIANVAIEVGGKSEVQLFEHKEQLTEVREVLHARGNKLTTLIYVNDQMRPMRVSIPQLSMEMIDCNEAYAMTPPE